MQSDKKNGVLMAIVAALALGAGVTGTLAWMENRERAPVSAPSVSTSPNSNPAIGSAPLPQPSTVGMTPAQAAVTLGNYHYDIGQWPQAIAQYRVAIGNGLDNPNVRTDMGNALRFDNQAQKALEQYKIAQKQDPNHQQSLFNQGGLWAITLKDSKKGVAAWRAFVKRFPTGETSDQARKFIAQYE